jgi:hypothetical protein
MRTLTQVWLIVATSCLFFLILGFHFGGRLGLLIAFVMSLFFFYLLFDRGLKILMQKTRAHEVKGKDTTQFMPLLQKSALQYEFKKVRLFTTQHPTPPLVWPEFSNQVVVFMNATTLTHLSESEKKILVHILLSHGFTQSRLMRKVLGLMYISLAPVNNFFSPFFNVLGYLFGLSKEIYKADLKALTTSGITQFEFGLLMHKLHYLSMHTDKIFEGTYFFSILSKNKPRILNLKFHPSIDKREKNILGYSI